MFTSFTRNGKDFVECHCTSSSAQVSVFTRFITPVVPLPIISTPLAVQASFVFLPNNFNLSSNWTYTYFSLFTQELAGRLGLPFEAVGNMTIIDVQGASYLTGSTVAGYGSIVVSAAFALRSPYQNLTGLQAAIRALGSQTISFNYANSTYVVGQVVTPSASTSGSSKIATDALIAIAVCFAIFAVLLFGIILYRHSRRKGRTTLAAAPAGAKAKESAALPSEPVAAPPLEDAREDEKKNPFNDISITGLRLFSQSYRSSNLLILDCVFVSDTQNHRQMARQRSQRSLSCTSRLVGQSVCHPLPMRRRCPASLTMASSLLLLPSCHSRALC